ncbi:uncharacterized protein LOC105398088 [Plutella xylostella]|uniref:uncharacterized protein LOC105398088 n=1 Tax=Plutella xylostella TaxID=51655 RepID=UPI0005D045AD|nr:uncharacterized protein LOC105398088 [Plutella xylostella]XP_048483628.1 uncharacterized protein LOC105398088 [Plutella xylostella]
MSAMCVGLICAIILAVFVVIWITYCMFCRERHKSELYQYNISDLLHKNQIEAQNLEEKKESGLAAGIFILPSRHKQADDEYEKRPDYPESPVSALRPGPDDLVKILDDSDKPDCDARNYVTLDNIGSNSQYHSEV